MIATCLVIAGSTRDTDKLQVDGIATKLQAAFNVECVLYCHELSELCTLCHDCSEVKALLYLNSFPQSYDDIVALSKQAPAVTQLFRASYDMGRVWIYDGDVVVDCVTEEDIPKAIHFSRKLDKYFEERISPCAVALGVFLLLCTMIFHAAQQISLSIEPTAQAETIALPPPNTVVKNK